MRNFETDFRSFAQVQLGVEDYNRAAEFASRVITAKASEQHHQADGDREQERWVTGILGEMAMERFLGSPFIDWTVGNSDDYNRADLAGLNVAAGIKTVKRGQYPVVHRDPQRPEVILVRDGLAVHVCGLASPEVMRQYADENLILNARLRARGTKTGFWGFAELVPFDGLAELQRLSWKMVF